MGAGTDGMKAMLLLIDPGCSAINDLVAGLDYAYADLPKLGASRASTARPMARCCWAIGCAAAPWAA